MTGGLDNAESYLLHPFLKRMLSAFGGSPNLYPENVTPAVNSLKKQLGRSPTFDLRSERETTVLASLIVKAAKGLRYPMDDILYEDLREDWATHRNAIWARRQERTGASPADRPDGGDETSLDACLTGMRKHKMLFQGHLWTCGHCHHRNWIDMSALRPTLVCEVCGATADAPVDIQWRFRPNQFLIESLRDHSVLSLVWTLSALRDQSQSSFMYAPPTSFGYTLERTRSAEADLLVICDGHPTLCEAKSSWRLVRDIDLKDFSALALRLRPDRALFAVMETGAGPLAAIEEARQDLGTAGIQFEVMTPVSDDRYDSPYLPHS